MPNKSRLFAGTIMIGVVLTFAVAIAAQMANGSGFSPIYENGQVYLYNATAMQVNAITATPAGGKVSYTVPSGQKVPTGIPANAQVKVYGCFAPTYPYDSNTGYSAGWDTGAWYCK